MVVYFTKHCAIARLDDSGQVFNACCRSCFPDMTKLGLGSLLVEAISAVDDFESFAFFMGTVAVTNPSGHGRDEQTKEEGQRKCQSQKESSDDDNDERRSAPRSVEECTTRHGGK